MCAIILSSSKALCKFVIVDKIMVISSYPLITLVPCLYLLNQTPTGPNMAYFLHDGIFGSLMDMCYGHIKIIHPRVYLLDLDLCGQIWSILDNQSAQSFQILSSCPCY